MDPLDLLKTKLQQLGMSDVKIGKMMEAHPGIEKEIQKGGAIQVVAWKLVMEGE